MKKSVMAAVAATAMLSASPGYAAPLLYDYAESGGPSKFTFVLDDKPQVTPLFGDKRGNGFGVTTVLTLFGPGPLLWNIQFFRQEIGGGFSALGASGDNMVGQQLFSGTVDNPTMLAGRFNLVNQYTGNLAVLTVTAIPEPTTWAMMMVGFGLIGANVRYRRRNTTTALI